MVYKPVISYFHSFITVPSENLLELKGNRQVRYIVSSAQKQRGSFLP